MTAVKPTNGSVFLNVYYRLLDCLTCFSCGFDIARPLWLSTVYVKRERASQCMACSFLNDLQRDAERIKQCDVEVSEGVETCLPNPERLEQYPHLATTEYVHVPRSPVVRRNSIRVA